MILYVYWPGVLAVIGTILFLAALATALVFIVGLILGLILYFGSPSPSTPLFNSLNFLLRSLPFLIPILLILPAARMLLNYNFGTNAALPVLILGGAPFFARIVEQSLKEVEEGVIQTARFMGASTLSLIFKVLLPESLPALIAGITLTGISLLGFSALATLLGSTGIEELYQLLSTDQNWIAATTILIIIALVIQYLSNMLIRMIDKR